MSTTFEPSEDRIVLPSIKTFQRRKLYRKWVGLSVSPSSASDSGSLNSLFNEDARRVSVYPSYEPNDEDFDTDLESDFEEEVENYDPQGKKVYLNACKKHGVVPSSFVLRNLGSKALKMSGVGLGARDALVISIPLLTNISISTLDLSENRIGGEGMRYLWGMLKENVSLTELNVSHNDLGSYGAYLLADIINFNVYLRTVRAAGNRFSDSDADYFVEPLKASRLKILDLSHNEFRERGGMTLAPAIVENDMLEELDLSWNHLRLKGAVAIAQAMKDNIGIKRLNLSWNGFGTNGATAIGRTLKENDTLEELDLTCNRLEKDAIEQIAKGLAKNETLTVLKLSRNSIGQDGVLILLEAVKKNTDSRLQKLEFMFTEINEQADRIISQIRSKRPKFKVIHSGLALEDPNASGRLRALGKMEDPLRVLLDYMKVNNMRLMDLFTQFDQDRSMTVTIQEFRTGVKLAHIPLTELQLEELIHKLDINDNGEIDFTEMMSGHKKHKTKERRRRLKDEELERLRTFVDIKSESRKPKLSQHQNSSLLRTPKISIMEKNSSAPGSGKSSVRPSMTNTPRISVSDYDSGGPVRILRRERTLSSQSSDERPLSPSKVQKELIQKLERLVTL